MGSTSAPKNGPTSLIAQAAEHRLPRHQYMDRATLAWITFNRPAFAHAGPGAPVPVDAASVLIPDAWFAETRVVDSIHGLRHGARTAILAMQLAHGLELGTHHVAEARIAGAVHDCRRVHDQNDAGHGARCAAWFRDNVARVSTHLAVTVHGLDINRIATAIELHVVPYSEFAPAQQARYQRAAMLVDIVKTADAVDRYRLPKLKWWLREEHLRLPPPSWLLAYGFDLVVASESAWLQGLTSAEAIAAALAGEPS